MRISIEDQGPGLAPEHLDRIFEKFYRANLTESSPSGTGLGLFISRAIVEAHGGKITASSGPQQGTRISFTLPLA
jgi:signal transduction histidine kinase